MPPRLFALLAVALLLAGCALPQQPPIPTSPKNVSSASPSVAPTADENAKFVPPLQDGCRPGGAGLSLPADGGNAIQHENALPGDAGWRVAHTSEAIKGYAAPFSALPGEALTVRVSTNRANFSADVVRLGWYHGAGGRIIAREGPFAAQKQPDLLHDNSTNLVQAEWAPSFNLTVGAAWPTGVYLLRLNTSDGLVNYVPFVVRSPNNQATFLYHTSEFTWQAYNSYGGSSLYTSDFDGFERAYQVSFDRPFSGRGTGDLEKWEVPMISWLECQGYSLDYAADVDVDHDLGLLLAHRAVIQTGHDEYWTSAMRDHLQAARDHGVHLAFFGANEGYWQVRIGPNAEGVPNRLITCYKNRTLDPLAGVDPYNATVRFREDPVDRPESNLLGLMYELDASAHSGYYTNLTFTAEAARALAHGPPNGTVVPGVMGNEWDRYPGDAPPPSIHILARSEGLDHANKTRIQQTALWRAPSGALVFAAGTIGWSLGLGKTERAVRDVTTDVLAGMAGDPEAIRVEAVPNA